MGAAFLDLLKRAGSGISTAAQGIGGAMEQGFQNPLVNSIAGIPLTALQIPQALLQNYVDKFRAPGIQNRLHAAQADQAQVDLSQSPAYAAAQFNPPPGVKVQGTPVPGPRRRFQDLTPEMQQYLLRYGVKPEQWEGASFLPSNLPAPVDTKETSAIAQQRAATWKANMDAWATGTMLTQGPPKGLVPTGWKDPATGITYGVAPAPQQLPYDPNTAPAASGPPAPLAAGGETAPPAPAPAPGAGARGLGRATGAGGVVGSAAVRPPALPPGPTVFTTDTGEQVRGTIGRDGMSIEGEGGRRFLYDAKTGRVLEHTPTVPAASGTTAAPPPAPAEGTEPPPGATPPPAATPPATPPPAAAPTAEEDPTGTTPMATAEQRPAIPPAGSVGSVSPVPAAPPPVAPGPAAAGAAPPAPAPGTAPPGAAPTPTTPPAAPTALAPEDAQDMELLAPGSTASEAPVTGYAPPAPALAPGETAGGMAGVQLAQADTGDITTPREAVTGPNVAKPPGVPNAWLKEMRTAAGSQPADSELNRRLSPPGRAPLSEAEAFRDKGVVALVDQWWAAEKGRRKASEKQTEMAGRANQAVQRQLGSAKSLRAILDLAAQQHPGEPGSAYDVPMSEGWAATSKLIDRSLRGGKFPGDLLAEIFSGSGIGLPTVLPEDWMTPEGMANTKGHPWSRPAGELLQLGGVSGLGVRSLGDVGTMTDKEKQLFVDYYIPQATDPPHRRQQKYQQALAILDAVQQGMEQGLLATPQQLKAFLTERGAPLFFADPDRLDAEAAVRKEGAPQTTVTPGSSDDSMTEPQSRAPRSLTRPTRVARQLTRRAVA